MRSRLAETLREERRRSERALSPQERLDLARRLGDEAAKAYARLHGVTEQQAIDEFARRRRAGRRPSRAAGE